MIIKLANVVMALFSPSSVNMERFQNYDITRLGDSFRNLEILLNRDGEPNINLGLNFIGPCGTFREMPRASEITNDHYEKSAKYINSKSQYVKQNNVWIPNPLIN